MIHLFAAVLGWPRAEALDCWRWAIRLPFARTFELSSKDLFIVDKLRFRVSDGYRTPISDCA